MTLSDGSATPISFAPSITAGAVPTAQEFWYKFSVKSATAGQTATLTFGYTSVSSASQVQVRSITIK
jgi:hypothetical protein